METPEDAVGSPINETFVDVVRSVPITYRTGETVETEKHSPMTITAQPSPSDQPPVVVQMQGTHSQSSSLGANMADSDLVQIPELSPPAQCADMASIVVDVQHGSHNELNTMRPNDDIKTKEADSSVDMSLKEDELASKEKRLKALQKKKSISKEINL